MNKLDELKRLMADIESATLGAKYAADRGTEATLRLCQDAGELARREFGGAITDAAPALIAVAEAGRNSAKSAPCVCGTFMAPKEPCDVCKLRAALARLEEER